MTETKQVTDTRRSVGRPTLGDDVLRARKQAILDEALTLVAERGTHSVRLKDVAAAAKVSVGTLQHYFDSRDQLMREAFAQHAYGVIDSVVAHERADDDPWKHLQALLDAQVFATDFKLRCRLWMEFAGASLHDDDLRRLMSDVYEAWRRPVRDAVKRGVRAGAFTPVISADAVVASLLALLDGCEMAVALEVRGASAKSVAAELKAAASALLGVSTLKP